MQFEKTALGEQEGLAVRSCDAQSPCCSPHPQNPEFTPENAETMLRGAPGMPQRMAGMKGAPPRLLLQKEYLHFWMVRIMIPTVLQGTWIT